MITLGISPSEISSGGAGVENPRCATQERWVLR